MEENVALDSSKQKQFVKSIKKLIKKNDVKDEVKVKDVKIQKKKQSSRGLVYLGHIPHGFYENAMAQYFKQFGMVTNVRVIRSKRTGNSKGFAFVEFKEPAVAEIVAETMNNYLMGKRLIKAAYIPPEKQRHHSKRKFWNYTFNPGSEARIKMKKAYNADKDEKGDLQKARKLLSNLTRTKKKLSDLGISYDFFEPVDVPEGLQQMLPKPAVKEENEVDKGKLNKKSKKEKKFDDIDIHKRDKKDKKPAIQKEIEKPDVKKQSNSTIQEKTTSKRNKNNTEIQVNDKEQNQKEKKLKAAGVKPVENFIKINESDGDSDSSYAFDSDEFEKMLANASDADSDEASDDNVDDEQNNPEESESEEETPPKIILTPKVVSKPPKKEKQEKKLAENKRKASQNIPVSPKKSKFKNRNTQKLVKKQFKKK